MGKQSLITNNFKVGDIVCVEPFGENPPHYCEIEYFKEWETKPSPIFAMGIWFSKKGNCIAETGFDVNYIKLSTQQNLKEAIESFKNRV